MCLSVKAGVDDGVGGEGPDVVIGSGGWGWLVAVVVGGES